MRIIVVSHSHPDITKGGAENAAIAHFHALKAQGHDCLFVALTPHGNIGHDGRFGAFRGREDELLWVGAEFDDFRLTARNFHQVMKDMDEMIGDFKPDLIHFHHYFGIGLDVIQEIKESKGIKVFLTLHEYGGICHHYGQMIKTSKELCYASSPSECAKCFPGTASGFFFLRRERILRALNSLDGIVSPSAFLAKRYAEFGVDAHRLHVVENLVSVRYGAAPEAKAPVVAYSEDRPLVLGYFGQFTPFKGVDVVLKAMKLLPETTLEKIRVVLYGTAHGQANQEFFCGPGRNHRESVPDGHLEWWLQERGRGRADARLRLDRHAVGMVGKRPGGAAGGAPVGRAGPGVERWRHGREGGEGRSWRAFRRRQPGQPGLAPERHHQRRHSGDGAGVRSGRL
ncbi:expE7 [Asticcacaulis biprosthecium C19]|uniref:ExpE7 n=1 Tax=Asticcacaulis biprosthecium C19 TaxID=715226 RepID=F4QM08_9CAUL|nr:glycosyltransferase [Asticcacaulis biprosthecium]EGF93580.1 expE7 [Asticcacaulis biprosthecium C19]